MTDFLIENITEETQIAFNFQDRPDSEGGKAFQHDFGDALAFPSLSEWSRHSINNTGHRFDGISFKNSDLKPYVTVTMAESQAGFKNMFGKYVVDENGYMHSASILAHNTRDISAGDKVSFQQTDATDDLQFFLVANGYSYNKHIEESDGVINFVHGYGTSEERLAKVTDNPETIDLIYKTAEQEVKLSGSTYHTSNPQLNKDGKLHSISGLAEEGDTNSLRVGFEDFPNLGDSDFNDLIFDVEIAYLPSDAIIAHSLNDKAPASGNDDVTLKDLNDSLYDGDGFLNNMIDFSPMDEIVVADGEVAVADDSTHSEEGLETLLALDGIAHEYDVEDAAISDFVEQTAAASEISAVNACADPSGLATADLTFLDNSMSFGDLA